MGRCLMLSDRLRTAVRLSSERQYRLAHRIGVHPSTLSQWLIGFAEPKAGDARVIALGRLVGVPESECFAPETEIHPCAG